MQITPRKVRAFMCRYTNVDKSAECHHLEIVEQELENLLFKAISKQAQVIMNIDRLDASSKLTLHAEQQAEYKKKIKKLQDEKSMLYERYVLNELDVADYKSGKAGIDAELAQMMRALEKLNSEAAACSAAKSSDDELRDVAEKALAVNKLTRPLVDLLVEKVYVYPGNQIEIEWKYADFFEASAT
jgi:predicted nuclease with TOPRIM domain